MTVNAVSRCVRVPRNVDGKLYGTANLGACGTYVEHIPDPPLYTPTVIVTDQSELDTELAKSAAQLEGQVIGVQYNATPYTISRTQLRKNYGVGGLVITQYGGTMPVFEYVYIETATNFTLHSVEVSNPSGTADLVRIYTQCNDITIDSCTIHGKYYDPTSNLSAGVTNPNGIHWVSNGSGATQNVYITDCEVYDCKLGIYLQHGGGDLEIVGNTVYRCYEDNIKLGQLGASTSTKVNWNTLSLVMGKGTDSGSPHPDSIQFLGSSLDWGGIEIIGNVIFCGVTRGDSQGIFLDDMPSGKYFTALIKGNVVGNTSVRGITVSSPKNCSIIGNSVVVGDMSEAATPGIYLSEVAEGGGNVVKNNCAGSYSLGTATASNNHTFSAINTSAFAAVFDGAAFEDSDLDARSKILTAYSMKVGGALDQTVNIGAVGSGYVDYAARTLNGAME